MPAKPVKSKNKPKMIQISANNDGVFGLDENGDLYWMSFLDTLGRKYVHEWEKFETIRTLPPERSRK